MMMTPMITNMTIIIIKPHHLHTVHRCGRLLQMSHTECTVCVSVLGTQLSCAKMA